MQFRDLPPTEAEFRSSGWSSDALNFPLSDQAYAYRLRYNGINASDNEAWKYAPNAWVQNDLHVKGGLAVEDQDAIIMQSRIGK